MNALDPADSARELHRLLKASDGLHGALTINPRTVREIYTKGCGTDGCTFPSINELVARNRSEIRKTLAVLRYERIEKYE